MGRAPRLSNEPPLSNPASSHAAAAAADGSQLTKLYGSEKLVPGAGPAEPGLTDVPAAPPRPIMPL